MFVFVVMFILAHIKKLEGFNTETLDDFIKLQTFNNPNTFFNLGVMEQQVSNEEMEEYNKQGHWTWDEATQNDYQIQLNKSTIQQEYPVGSYMAADQLLYNQTAMNRILSLKAPEGEFLMNGVHVENKNKKETIDDKTGNFSIESGELPITSYSDSYVCNNGLLSKRVGGSYISTYEPVNISKLPDMIPGFKFIKGPCDPCVALHDTPDYSCPFTLNDQPTSSIWKRLWNL
jgi:hypothetical protein